MDEVKNYNNGSLEEKLSLSIECFKMISDIVEEIYIECKYEVLI